MIWNADGPSDLSNEIDLFSFLVGRQLKPNYRSVNGIAQSSVQSQEALCSEY